MNTNLKKLLALTSLTAIGTFAFQSQAQALTFSLDPTSNTAGGEFRYDLELEAGESITQGNGSDILADFLTLTNFTGTASASNPYTLDGSGATSANLSVNTDTTGAITLPDVVVLNATNFTTGTINYDLSFSGGTVNNTITGPVTAVPFEPSTNLGIFTLFGIWGFNRYRRKLKSNQ